MNMNDDEVSESLRRIERRQHQADRRAEDHVETRFDARVQTVLAVLAVIVSVALAYGALDKRIALVEQKLDAISAQVARLPR